VVGVTSGESPVDPDRFQCCFCGHTILATVREPIEITIAFADRSSQSLWSHVDCLGSRLHSSVPWLSLKDLPELGE
jgi:hypothetical protein